MPTPVTTARQCLTPEAAHALDEAVNVARRRGHGQTTSLHAVSALLSLPSSVLRDACARARNSAYSPRLQFKALELCLSVSLDRVPASQLSSDDPPVSNSLMAAIKRSQANQRRQPENFHLYHQISQQQTSASMSCIKVELQNLILSILDDPVVSRVFGEAGFPSTEIKLAIVRPLPQVFKFSRFKAAAPPIFHCNLGDNSDLGSGRRGFSFPFLGFTGNINGDENCRRIGEVLARHKARNPLLVGACAYDALTSFSGGIEKGKDKILPSELLGIRVISIENDITKFLRENSDKAKFEQVGKYVEQNLGTGLVLNLGDMKSFGNGLSDSDAFVVEKLTEFLHIQGKKVWLIGSTSSYEGYLKLISKFPSIEKEWDLQLLPITSSVTSTTQSYPKSSLMESFVPFGGFFSTPSELNTSLTSSYQFMSRCHQCNKKCEQEVLAISKGGFVSSVADQYQSNLPSWLRVTELGTQKGPNVKTRDDGVVLGAKVAGVQKKWDSICRRLHHSQLPGSNIHPSQLPTVVGVPLVDDKKEDAEKYSKKISGKLLGVPSSEDKSDKPIKADDSESDGFRFPRSFSNSSLADSNQESPAKVTSVTTDLGLRLSPVPTCDNRKKSVNKSNSVAAVSGIVSENCNLSSSSSSSSRDFSEQFDSSNFKNIFRALIEEVSWQEDAVHIISQTIADCRTRNERRRMWFNFRGPDKFGMKKIVAALAEIVYGSRENLISADLSPENLLIRSQSQDGHCYDVMFRGKTIIDYVGAELFRKPLSVVFLENVDKAEVPTQNCLSHAFQTGKFSYSNGREVGIRNAIFVTTSAFTDDEILESRKDFCTYTEEKILRAKGCQMQLLLEQAPTEKRGQNLNLSVSLRKNISDSMFVNKRKMVGANRSLQEHEISEVVKRAHITSSRILDLNLPAEDNAQASDDGINSNNDSMSSNSRDWLLDSFDQLVRTVFFKPFDFNAAADKILNAISDSFRKIVGSECSFYMDPKVMEQLLAAAYLSGRERAVENWVEEVLSRGLVEFSKRHHLKADSIVKLLVCKGMILEEHMPGVLLPSKILI